jgi:hypothetical protein
VSVGFLPEVRICAFSRLRPWPQGFKGFWLLRKLAFGSNSASQKSPKPFETLSAAFMGRNLENAQILIWK